MAVAFTCIGGLANPLIGLYGYLWYSIARPDAMSWSEGALPHSLLMAICTLVGTWRFIPNLRAWFTNAWVQSMILLQLVILASVLFAQFFNLSWTPYVNFMKYAMIALIIPLFVVKLEDFRWVVLVVAFAVGMIGFRFGVFGLMHGGIHIESGLGGFMSDNNTLALAMLMGLPFIWYSREIVPYRIIKPAIYLVLFLTIGASVMTHSRGGILTLLVLFMVLTMRSRHKVTVAIVLVLLGLPTTLLVYNSLLKRMATLENVDEDGSASARMAYSRAAWKMFKDYPVIGVGFGTYNWVALSTNYLPQNEKQHVVHNNYLQMAADSGIFALLLLLWQILYSIWWLGRNARRLKKTHPHLLPYARSLEGGIIAFAVGSTFASRTDYDFYYFLIMMVGSWYTITSDLSTLPATATAESTTSMMIPAWTPVIGPAVALATGTSSANARPAASTSAIPNTTPVNTAPAVPERRWRTPDSPIRGRSHS